MVRRWGSGQSVRILRGRVTDSFTWELTKDGFKTKGDDKLTFKDDGDKITTKLMGVNIGFEKQ